MTQRRLRSRVWVRPTVSVPRAKSISPQRRPISSPRRSPTITAFALHLADQLGTPHAPYDILDSSALPLRNANRRERSRLIDFHLLTAVTAEGVMTRFGFGPASTNDRPLAETFFALWAQPDPRLSGVGRAANGPYVANTGFSERHWEARWIRDYRVQVVCSPRRTSQPRVLRRSRHSAPRHWAAAGDGRFSHSITALGEFRLGICHGHPYGPVTWPPTRPTIRRLVACQVRPGIRCAPRGWWQHRSPCLVGNGSNVASTGDEAPGQP
jgi:hypothetical protein